MQIQEILVLLKTNGWYLVEEKEDIRQFKHPLKTERITIAGQLGNNLSPESANSIFQQAGLKGIKK